jgi:hypothetical protein
MLQLAGIDAVGMVREESAEIAMRIDRCRFDTVAPTKKGPWLMSLDEAALPSAEVRRTLRQLMLAI